VPTEASIVVSARFSRRFPPRLSRYRTVLPEDAGIGQVPANDAIAASERNRLGWDQAIITVAATTVPTPVRSSSSGACLVIRSGDQYVLEDGVHGPDDTTPETAVG